MKTKLLNVALVVTVVFSLFGCGGGGDSTPTTPPAFPPPTAKISLVTPAQGTVGVAPGADIVFKYLVENVDSVSIDAKSMNYVCSGRTITFTSTALLSADKKELTVTVKSDAGLVLADDSCTLSPKDPKSGVVTVVGPGGSYIAPEGTSFSTSAFVAPAKITAIGATTTMSYVLAVGCDLPTLACYKNANIPAIDSGLKDAQGRDVLSQWLQYGAGGPESIFLIYRDGTPVFPTKTLSSGFGQAFKSVTATTRGPLVALKDLPVCLTVDAAGNYSGATCQP